VSGLGDDIQAIKADADGLHGHHIFAESVQQEHDIQRPTGQTTHHTACGHTAHEHASVAMQLHHAHAITQNGAAAKRAGGIDGDDPHTLIACSVVQRQARRERRLSRAGRAGDADDVRAAGSRVQAAHRLAGIGLACLDSTDQPRECESVALQQALG